MKQLFFYVLKFRALFVVLGVVGLLLVAGNFPVEGGPALISWNPSLVQEGDEVTFSTIDSYDSYKWWKSDGPGTLCTTVGNTPVSEISTYTYTFYEAGAWQVCFEGTVGTGESAVVTTDAQTVTVTNLPPVIDDPLDWTVSAEPSLVDSPFHVEVRFDDYEDTAAYSCTINYGDGTGEVAGDISYLYGYDEWLCTGPDHTYTTAGQFDVEATVYDVYPDSYSTSSYYSHTVNEPAHVFTWDTTALLEGDVTTFTAIAGYNTHYWLRSSQPGGSCDTYANTGNPADIYFGTSGVYQVCLSMFDDITDEQVSDSQYVTVTNVAPSIYGVYFYPPTSLLGMDVSGYVTFTDYDDAPYTVVIDWGDGSSETTIVTNETNLDLPYHTYAATGSYTVQVRVTDKYSATGTSTVTHNVSTVLVEEYSEWLASNYQTTTIELQGATIGAESLTVSIPTLPTNGTLGIPSAAVCQPFDMPMPPVEDLVLCKATVVYTPGEIPQGGTYDSFTFTMSDGTNTSLPGEIDLWVGPNTAPTAQADSETLSTVTPSYIILTATDTDIIVPDPNLDESFSDRITFSIDSQPENGTLGTPENPYCNTIYDEFDDADQICTSAVLYTPNPGTTATTDSFTFHVNDTHQDSATATVTLTLRAPTTLNVNAADDVVDVSGCDWSHCSLREAVNAAWVGDNIAFTLSLPNTIVLVGDEILINKNITISGPGADQLAISGGALPADGNDGLHDRVFEFSNNYQPMNASISGLTIKDGRSYAGGGIRVSPEATVTVTDCVIGPNNIVTYAGGGIDNEGGTLTLNRSTVVENHGTGTLGGAGISTSGSESTTTLINSTVTGNVTNNYGGGILAAYGGTVNLIHSTVSENLANFNYDTESWGGGGGIAIRGDGSVSIQNSIVAGNMDFSGLVDPGDYNYHPAWTDVSGAFTSLGGNLVGDGTGSSGWIASDQVGTDASLINPMLEAVTMDVPDVPHDPYYYWWYPVTYTYALLEGSPAIDAAPSCAAVTDQRGVTRPQGLLCDIGAFELEQTVVDTTPPELTITGATADGTDMAGDLATGFILQTDNNPAFEHQMQFKSGTSASETLADEHFGFYLVDTTVSAADLVAYYTARGVPDPYLTYLNGAAAGTNPFVMINGTTVMLVDAAKYSIQDVDLDMAVPDDFPLGTFTVQGDIADVAGNLTTVTLKLIVSGDRVAPVVTVPDPMTVSATDAGGAVVTFEVSAYDIVDGNLLPVCSQLSGYKFPLGPTTVTCTATDTAGNIGNASFTVTVTDQTNPVVTVPSNMTVPAADTSGAIVGFIATALDDVDGVITPTCDPASGTIFPVGTTTVTCSATDVVGNIGNASFTVTVVQSMHISSITLTNKAGRTNTITGLVTIQSYLGAPLSKAAVTVEWHLPSGSTVSKTVSTDRNGVAKFVLRGMPAGTYELCVKNVVKSGWMFNPIPDGCSEITVP